MINPRAGLDPNIATDSALLAVSRAFTWGLQPTLATVPYRAGIWPRMDGNRYSGQPDVGLAAQSAIGRTEPR